VAPATVTRLSGLAARLLPNPPDGNGEGAAGGGMVQGHGIGRPAHTVTEKVRGWGSVLNDRAARRYNQHLPGPPTSG
jgi:hypothetical protein